MINSKRDLTLERVLKEIKRRGSTGLLENVIYSVELLRKGEGLSLTYSDKGFYLSFSGGKDSMILYHITKLAGVTFESYMNLTSIDPPEVIKFVKEQYPDVNLVKPKNSIYNQTIKQGILPTQALRWCCRYYKEYAGVNRVTLTGVRKEESIRRRNRKEVISFKTKTTKGQEYSFDEFSEQMESQITCVNGNDKIVLNPILEWTTNQVWEFIKLFKLNYCSLYDQGYHRVGCILCPMSSYQKKLEDIKRYPHVKQRWVNTIQKLIDLHKVSIPMEYLGDPNEIFEWWIYGKNLGDFLRYKNKQL